ncbi:hypothetical protein EV127DRAFT_46666 [Xylaria flabelliformis]|nr:hypothetical protein EV127DRAFT_46666 [Xylaria flabelliformis]
MASALGLLGLPVEMNVEVLSFALLNSNEDALNLAISCKAMYGIFKNHKTSILLAFLSQMDPKDLAIATAHYHATIIPWRWTKDFGAPVSQDQNDYLSKITDFCEQHLGKQGTELHIQLQDFTFPMVAHIRDIHLIIRRIATKVAPRIISPTERWPAPSSVEIAKISKALYMIDLVQLLLLKTLVASNQHASFDISQRDHAFTKFWLCFAPWEREQANIVTGAVFDCLQYGRPIELWYYSISDADFTRFIFWRGMKGIDRIIRDGISEDDKRLHTLILKDPRFKVIRDIPSRLPYCWPEGPRYPLTVDSKILERYDIDESARVYLCFFAGLHTSGRPVRRGSGHFNIWIPARSEYGWSIFFDLDHLLLKTRGRLPTFAHLAEILARHREEPSLIWRRF